MTQEIVADDGVLAVLSEDEFLQLFREEADRQGFREGTPKTEDLIFGAAELFTAGCGELPGARLARG